MTEIERKFLVTGDYKSLAHSSSRIRQGYICADGGRTVRVRLRDGVGTLTVKGPSSPDGVSRFEWETEVGHDDAVQMLGLCRFCRREWLFWLSAMYGAALEAGIAFNNSSVTIIHGMSRPIGALFHVAHGLSNAILLKECLSFALPGAWKRFGDLGRAVGAASETDTDQEAGRKFLAEVESLVQELDIPDLEGAGIQREKFFEVIDKMAHDAMESGSPQNTMRDVTEEQVKEIYKKLW